MIENKKILLIISGGIAAYKSLELIRLMRRAGAHVRCILTGGGSQFITPLSVGALSGNAVYTDLFSLKDETEMGHIRLSRECDLVVVAPASANMIAKIAHGLADDLAAATILATDKKILIAPAMNVMMWENMATQDNIRTLQQRGILQVGPGKGDMACGETGFGRMAEPEEILGAVVGYFQQNKPLAGRRALVTSGPTYEPLDPVRFIGNRSSGKQGHAIAAALSDLGAAVTLISGPVSIPDPNGVKTVHVQTAAEMLAACQGALPADIAVCAAAVSDWTPAMPAPEKIKKRADRTPPDIKLQENPDILKALAKGAKRPELVIGFAAETEKLLDHAKEKLAVKGCDWIIANLVSGGEKVFGAEENKVYLLTNETVEEWPRAKKTEIARRLAAAIAEHFGRKYNVTGADKANTGT